VRKSRDNGKNLDVNDQPWSGRPVTTDHRFYRQIVKKKEKKKLFKNTG
jgi:hypothetical protein